MLRKHSVTSKKELSYSYKDLPDGVIKEILSNFLPRETLTFNHFQLLQLRELSKKHKKLIDELINQTENAIYIISNILPVDNALSFINYYRSSEHFKNLREKHDKYPEKMVPKEFLCYAMFTDKTENITRQKLNQAKKQFDCEINKNVLKKIDAMLAALQCNEIKDVNEKIQSIRQQIPASLLEHYLFRKLLNLSNTDLIGADLGRLNLAEFNFKNTNLTKANLRSNLARAQLDGSILIQANLERANLMNANLSGADLRKIYLWRAFLTGACLKGADLENANLAETDLRGADLSGANLTGANLSCSNLSGANLSNANLTGANLIGANISETDLGGAIIENTKFFFFYDFIWDEEKSKENLINYLDDFKNMIYPDSKKPHPQAYELRKVFAKQIVIWSEDATEELALRFIKKAISHPIFVYKGLELVKKSIYECLSFFAPSNIELSDVEILNRRRKVLEETLKNKSKAQHKS